MRDEKRAQQVKLELCQGQNCSPYGGKKLAEELAERGVAFEIIGCRSLCTYAPVAFVEDCLQMKATADGLCEKVSEYAKQT
ncbi:MAG: (2Fe-2S) ferredoxin domain-containing protein [Ghiorsea sp.]